MDPIARSKLLRLSVASMLSLALGACAGTSQAGVATLSQDSKTAATEADAKDAEAELQEWTECMRENGVDIPDAEVGEDGGIRIGRRVQAGGSNVTGGVAQGGGAVRLGDDFAKAREECGDPPRIPGAGRSEEDLQELQENALKLANCMREEGVEDFPDPDFSNRGPGAGPGTRVAGGPFGAAVDMNDPKVQAAFEACRDELGEGSFVIRSGPVRAES